MFYVDVSQYASGYKGKDDEESNSKGRVREVYLDDEYRIQRRVVDFSPVVYESTPEKTAFKDLAGRHVAPVETSSIYNYQEANKDIINHYYAGDVHGDLQYIARYYPEEIKYDKKRLPVAYFDIETSSSDGFPDPDKAENPILSIAVYFKNLNKIKVFGTKEGYTPTAENINHICFKDEKEMLSHFWGLITHYSCYLIGWASASFDIPYLINRSIKIGVNLEEKGKNRILPFGMYSKKYEEEIGGETYKIKGLVHYDYMILIKKFLNEEFESFSLDFIARHFLDKGKVEYLDEHKSLMNLYENDYQKFITYNIQDAVLISDIDDKLDLFNLVLGLAYSSKINPNDVCKSTKLWEGTIYNELMKRGIVVPRMLQKEKSTIEGAYVKEVAPQMSKYVVSYDFASLYPSIMISYNISPMKICAPETLPPELKKIQEQVTVNGMLEKKYDLSILKKYHVSLAANGHFFDNRETDYVNEIVEKMFNERKEIKKKASIIKKEIGEDDEYKRLKNLEWSIKIRLNSYYGCLANSWFRFYDPRCAEAITKTGQFYIRHMGNKIDQALTAKLNKPMDYVKYQDTDSCYVCLEPLLKDWKKEEVDNKTAVDFLNKSSDAIVVPAIDAGIKEMLEYTNAHKPNLKMVREKIAKKIIFLKKKKYLMYVIADEDKILDEPKIAIKGVEIVRTDTPQKIRDKLREFVKLIFEVDDKNIFTKKVKEFKAEYMKFTAEEIAKPVGCSEISKYTTSNGMYAHKCPIHIRAAIMFNRYVEEKELNTKYPYLRDGEKIRYVYLKLPNPIKEDVIGFPQGYDYPADIADKSYIDYETMFEKTFIASMDRILSAVGWGRVNASNALF